MNDRKQLIFFDSAISETATLQLDLEFENFKRRPKGNIFKCISQLSGDMRIF